MSWCFAPLQWNDRAHEHRVPLGGGFLQKLSSCSNLLNLGADARQTGARAKHLVDPG
jgi:hypothetical protein